MIVSEHVPSPPSRCCKISMLRWNVLLNMAMLQLMIEIEEVNEARVYSPSNHQSLREPLIRPNPSRRCMHAAASKSTYAVKTQLPLGACVGWGLLTFCADMPSPGIRFRRTCLGRCLNHFWLHLLLCRAAIFMIWHFGQTHFECSLRLPVQK